MAVTDLTSGQVWSTLSDAITNSSAGDVIQVDAGTYVENFPDITHSLTIQSTGGMAYLSNPQPDPPNSRAIVNVPGNLNVSLTLSGLDISGAVNDATHPASIGGDNGAGILFESGNGNLVVDNCHIHNNEDGLLAGSTTAASLNGMTVTIRNSEIDHNGLPPTDPRFGYDHNIYINTLNQFTMTGSYSHDAQGGHEIKTRALNNDIENNRIFDGTAPASYEIDFADGGNNIVKNNIIVKGLDSPQKSMIDFGGEGTYAGSSLEIDGNIFVGDTDPSLLYYGANGLFNATNDPNTGFIDNASFNNNDFYGVPSIFEDAFACIYAPDVPCSYDIENGDQYFPLSSAPPLDTSSQFAMPAPGGLTPVLIAALVYVKLRRRFQRRARKTT